MKTISIEELHEQTDRVISQAAQDTIVVTRIAALVVSWFIRMASSTPSVKSGHVGSIEAVIHRRRDFGVGFRRNRGRHDR